MSKSWVEIKALVVVLTLGVYGMCKVGALWPLLMLAKWNHLYTE
jgi:hypothetical protein